MIGLLDINSFNRRHGVPASAGFLNGNFAFCILHFAIFAVFFCIAAPALAAAKPSFTTALDRESVIVGESVILTLKFEGISPKGMPNIPAIDGLQMTGGVSSSVNSTITPEGVSSVTSYAVN